MPIKPENRRLYPAEKRKMRPILFSAPMVRALLAGTKTQTRRVIKSPSRKHPEFALVDYGAGWWPFLSDDGESSVTDDGMETPIDCPYGKIGDRLWVRETWRERVPDQDGRTLDYRADHTSEDPCDTPWRPSTFMPRAYSRITLEITDISVERLQDISRGDAMAEGCPFPNMADGPDPRDWYRDLWNGINKGGWGANPWVWVVSIKVLP